MSLKSRIQDDVKNAMRAQQRKRLAVLRLVTAAIKQKEVDERIELDDAQVLAVLDKMVKQRRESLELIQTYLPEPLAEDELVELIRKNIEDTGASSIRDMGAVMNALRPQVQGRADMKAVSQAVKNQLMG
jgi:uncharacterized protein YqeY